MKKILITIVASLMAALTVGAATPAAASNGWMTATVRDGDQGGASVRLAATFENNHYVHFGMIQLTDLCPGDGNRVYFKVRVFANNTSSVVKLDSEKRENALGCGKIATPPGFNWNVAPPIKIVKVQVQVCIDKPNAWDVCSWSAVRYNQYR